MVSIILSKIRRFDNKSTALVAKLLNRSNDLSTWFFSLIEFFLGKNYKLLDVKNITAILV